EGWFFCMYPDVLDRGRYNIVSSCILVGSFLLYGCCCRGRQTACVGNKLRVVLGEYVPMVRRINFVGQSILRLGGLGVLGYSLVACGGNSEDVTRVRLRIPELQTRAEAGFLPTAQQDFVDRNIAMVRVQVSGPGIASPIQHQVLA